MERYHSRLPSKHQEAMRLFSDVSRNYPASVTAQAAALAIETKRNRRIPTLLRNMRYDDDAIETIAKAAESAHASAKNSSAPQFINRDILRGILDSEISWVDRMTRLRRHQLETILSWYEKYDSEQEYDLAVEEHFFPNQSWW